MRRDQFEFDVQGATGDETDATPPTLRITERGGDDDLRERLLDAAGDPHDGDGIDVAFRFRSSVDTDDPAGVLSVADRSTGAYILELPTSAATVEGFIDAVDRRAERTGAARVYRLCLRSGDDVLATYEKGILLVYAKDGTLLRHRSLIPAGIEL